MCCVGVGCIRLCASEHRSSHNSCSSQLENLRPRIAIAARESYKLWGHIFWILCRGLTCIVLGFGSYAIAVVRVWLLGYAVQVWNTACIGNTAVLNDVNALLDRAIADCSGEAYKTGRQTNKNLAASCYQSSKIPAPSPTRCLASRDRESSLEWPEHESLSCYCWAKQLLMHRTGLALLQRS